MTDDPNAPSPPPPGGPNPRPIWWGAIIGIAPALLNTLFVYEKSGVGPLVIISFLASVLLWPLAALILACRRATRRWGLGMVLGVGLGWLAMMAICGGPLLHK